MTPHAHRVTPTDPPVPAQPRDTPCGRHDVRVETVPDATLRGPSDAPIRITRACICGPDLWSCNGGPDHAGQRMGHEAIGIVEAVGSEVRTIGTGDLVIMPFASSDGVCAVCREGLPTTCRSVHFIGDDQGTDAAQVEALRVPQADGTLYPVPAGKDDPLMPSLLTRSDVMATGHHAAVVARVAPGRTAAVAADGAVCLCGVLAAKRGVGNVRSRPWPKTRPSSTCWRTPSPVILAQHRSALHPLSRPPDAP